MVAWPPSGPATVVILVVDYISELTIHIIDHLNLELL